MGVKVYFYKQYLFTYIKEGQVWKRKVFLNI